MASDKRQELASDVALYDLATDPGELSNLGDPAHPRYDPELIASMLAKLNARVDDVFHLPALENA